MLPIRIFAFEEKAASPAALAYDPKPLSTAQSHCRAGLAGKWSFARGTLNGRIEEGTKTPRRTAKRLRTTDDVSTSDYDGVTSSSTT